MIYNSIHLRYNTSTITNRARRMTQRNIGYHVRARTVPLPNGVRYDTHIINPEISSTIRRYSTLTVSMAMTIDMKVGLDG